MCVGGKHILFSFPSDLVAVRELFVSSFKLICKVFCCSETDFSAKQISQPGDQLCRVVTKVICFPLFVKYNFLQPAQILSVFVCRPLCREGNPGIVR